MTAIQILKKSKESERSLCNYIFDTARKLDDKPLINWIPSHAQVRIDCVNSTIILLTLLSLLGLAKREKMCENL